MLKDFGQAHVFFPEATDNRCTAAVLLDVDPVALVRRRDGGSLRQYVNDRPYAASSLLSVALARLFATAMGGRSKERPALAASEIPLEAQIPVIASRGEHSALQSLGQRIRQRLRVELVNARHFAPADDAADPKGYEGYAQPIGSRDRGVFEPGGWFEAYGNRSRFDVNGCAPEAIHRSLLLTQGRELSIEEALSLIVALEGIDGRVGRGDCLNRCVRPDVIAIAAGTT